MLQILRNMGLLCQHRWEPSGTGFDDRVKCVDCEHERDRRPGDVPFMDELEQKRGVVKSAPW